MMPTEPPLAFISHSSKDRPSALVIRTALEGAQVDCWMAPDDIAATADWAEAITRAIETAHGLVVLLSRDAIRSRQVAREVALAVEQDKRIVPIRLADVRPIGSLRYLLQLIQWIDAFPDLPRRGSDVGDQVRAALDRERDEGMPRHSAAQGPEALTSFIGRDAELEELASLLLVQRLVVLTGPGGIGKTRLALEAARRMEAEFEGGSLFVELDTVNEAARVLPHVAAAAGLELTSEPLDALRVNLGDRRVLLVLDNVEQIPVVSGPLNELLSGLPGAAILVTSRKPTRVTGERILRLDTLAAEAEDGDAVRLFLDRAREVGVDSASLDMPLAIEICRRLDGLPLAIEIAAAQARAFPLTLIIEQLDHHADLRSAKEDVPGRHRSLDAAIEWSHSLLSDSERRLFGRLSVFAGSFDLTAVRAVCSEDPDEAFAILEPLIGLFDNSLIAAAQGPRGRRFRMLETIREFARQKAVAEWDTLARKHFDYFDQFTSDAFPHLVQDDRVAWLDRLEDEEGNVLAALDRARQIAAVPQALRMASRFRRYWGPRGKLPDASAALERLLVERSGVDEAAIAEGLHALGAVRVQLSDLASARQVLAEALEIRRRAGDVAGEAATLGNLAAAHRYPGGSAVMKDLLAESIRLSKQVGDDWGAVASMANLAIAYSDDNEHDRAEEQYRKVAEEFAALGDNASVAMATLGRGSVFLRQRRLAEARPLIEKATEMYVELRDTEGALSAGLVRGQLEAWEGRFDEALDTLTHATRESVAVGDDYGVLEGLERLAHVASHLDQWFAAAGLLGRARAMREANDWPVESFDQKWLDDLEVTLRERLGQAQFDRLMNAGARLSNSLWSSPSSGDLLAVVAQSMTSQVTVGA